MHMADALVSPAVAGTMYAAVGVTAAYSLHKLKKDPEAEKKVPVMGVVGAFTFAAQMINFTIPGTGSSGHISGALMLTAMLGPYAAFLTMIAVLLVQCLFFADGGIMALGCNIWNMAFYGCFLGGLLIWKPMMKRGASKGMITAASIIGCVLALQFGAASVVCETYISGITELPAGLFFAAMQPIHLAIGLVEGLITAAVVSFVHSARPELIYTGRLSEMAENSSHEAAPAKTSAALITSFAAFATILIAGLFSLIASALPDGLEWSMIRTAGTDELSGNGAVYDIAGRIIESTSFMPDYSFGSGAAVTTSISGIVGCVIVAGIFLLAYAIIKKLKKTGKIDSTMREIHSVDMLAARDIRMNRISTVLKLILTVVYIVCTMAIGKYNLFGVLIMAVFPIAGFIFAKLSVRDAARRLLIVIPLVVFLGLFNPIFDHNVIVIGGFSVNAGLVSMTTLILKGLFALAASYILIATSGIDRICAALRALRVPRVIVTEVMLVYRYITVFLKEAATVSKAYALRAPKQRGIHISAWGPLAGQMLMRSMDRAGRVYDSMKLRGYDGDFRYANGRKERSNG